MTHTQFDDWLAAAMARTARTERDLAARRDGYHPGGLTQCKATGSGRRLSPAGRKARKLYARNPNLTPNQLAERAGISSSTARAIVREALGKRRRGPKPGEGGRNRTPASLEAERLLLAGERPKDVRTRTGLSVAQVHRIAAAIREERKAA